MEEEEGTMNDSAHFLFTKAVLFFFALIAVLITYGCGGGGGGGGSGTNYTGLTTPAAIDVDNSGDLVLGVYTGGDTAGSLNILGAASNSGAPAVTYPRPLRLSALFENIINEIVFQAQNQTAYQGAIVNESDTEMGSCGGSYTYNLNLNDQTGDFNGTLNFNNYCEDDFVMDGNTTTSGQVSLSSDDILNITFNYNNLTGTGDGESVTLKGTMEMVYSINSMLMSFTMTAQDNITSKTYLLEDWVMEVTEGPGYYDAELSGRYYDPDYGYVDFVTTAPLRFIDGDDDWPSSGSYTATGAPGTSGGPTMARLVVINSTTYEIDVDADGDGQYEYNSGPLLWENI
jgi:hypothetical protein